MGIIICSDCGKQAEHHAKNVCSTCYKKNHWKPRIIICKRCRKEKPHHQKGYCNNCSNLLFHYDHIKRHNYRKWHNIDLETHRKITAMCIICGFDKIVDLHHLDRDHKNNNPSNLVGLCPNHHKMSHMYAHKEEIAQALREKGFENAK